MLVDKAVLDEIIPKPGLFNPIVDQPTAEADPTSIPVIINSIFFLNFYISSYIHYRF